MLRWLLDDIFWQRKKKHLYENLGGCCRCYYRRLPPAVIVQFLCDSPPSSKSHNSMTITTTVAFVRFLRQHFVPLEIGTCRVLKEWGAKQKLIFHICMQTKIYFTIDFVASQLAPVTSVVFLDVLRTIFETINRAPPSTAVITDMLFITKAFSQFLSCGW